MTVPVVKHFFPVAVKCRRILTKITNLGKKWGTSDFSWGLVTFQGYSSPRPVDNLA